LTARWGTGCLCVAAALTLARPFELLAAPEPDQRVVRALQRFLARPQVAHAYSASRSLEASGLGHRGWMSVQTEFTPAAGLVYEVIDEGGSGYIRSHVLRSLLDEEQRLIARAATASVAITTANYQLTPEGIDEDRLAVVRMEPLRKERSLIDGRMLLTLDGDLVRLEGRLARSPSFWISRVTVVRSYERIDGVLMPVALDTTARLRFFGSSALRMTYCYSHIDDRAVQDADRWPRPASAPAHSATQPVDARP
jgi:hypothetical protein